MRSNKATFLSGLILGILVAAPVQAADAPSRVRVAVPMKVQRYAQHVFDTHDADSDGELSRDEWEQMNGEPKLADRDRDGAITASELTDHIARYGRRRKILLMPAALNASDDFPSLLRPEEKTPKDKASRPGTGPNASESSVSGNGTPGSEKKEPIRRFAIPRSRLPSGLPTWFRSLDRNGDGQLTLAEFAPDAAVEDIKEFATYDLNADGLLTADEYVHSTTRPAPRRPRAESELPAGDETFIDDPLDVSDGAEVAEEAEAVDVSAKEKATSPSRKSSMTAEARAELKKLKAAQRPAKKP